MDMEGGKVGWKGGGGDTYRCSSFDGTLVIGRLANWRSEL